VIHDAILDAVEAHLTNRLITLVPASDEARVGIVKQGDLQGEPDPDTARISVTLHENDPDRFISGAVTGMKDDWSDTVEWVEIGGSTTYRRKFTVKARCLLEQTKENLNEARLIASKVRTRIEHALPMMSFDGVEVTDPYAGYSEFVSRGIISEDLMGEMIQSGGPPDSYDYFIKFRFDVLTTRNG